MKICHRLLLAAIACVAGAPIAMGQVVINEVHENPPGSGTDPAWEYLELYGKPGMNLTGYAIALIKGGNEFGVPAEIDEAFTLDGLSLGSNGLLVLYNNTGGFSFIPSRVPVGTTIATFSATHIPTTDTPGNLANDDSSTYVLVRKRPLHSISGSTSVYAPGYAWRKDIDPDIDYNSRLDFEGIPVGGLAIEPYQMVDDVAWSHNGGKEYTRSTDNELSETPGFNPDALSRVAYYGSNPQRGHRFNSEGEIRFSRSADEEFIYGDIISTPGLVYDGTRSKGPTDPNGPKYDGSCNPDVGPCAPSPTGTLLFQDINTTGFAMTPGSLNDGGVAGIVQFRWVPGDFNFDGVADIEDHYLIHARLNATLDDTELKLDNNNTPTDPSDDFSYIGWKWQGRDFNGLLAMMDMNTTDGPGGTNAPFVTGADIQAHMFLIRAGEYEDMANGRR